MALGLTDVLESKHPKSSNGVFWEVEIIIYVEKCEEEDRRRKE